MATPALPRGTVTFLFTDVEGSTRLWERSPDQMRAALVEHDTLIEFLTEQHGGQVVRSRREGDRGIGVGRDRAGATDPAIVRPFSFSTAHEGGSQ